MLNGYSLQLVMASHHAMVLGDLLNAVVKHSLQRPLHDQILSYQSMFDICVREILCHILINVCADLEDCFATSKTVSGTRSSHHFVLISCNKIAHKLTSEETSFSSIWFKQIIDQINRYKKHQVFFVCQLHLW